MKSMRPKGGDGPEAIIQKDIIKKLRYLGWFVKPTHGNMYQSGFPDLFCCHFDHGARWVEVKLPEMKGSRYTAAQLRDFPKICANGSAVWVLTGDSDSEINKLFKPCNWWQYLSIMK